MNQFDIEKEISFREKTTGKIKSRMKLEKDEVELIKLKRRIIENCEITADLKRKK